jgi:hypothetical protein
MTYTEQSTRGTASTGASHDESKVKVEFDSLRRFALKLPDHV